MKAELLIDEHHVLDRRTFVEIVVWHLDRPVRGSIHRFKYRLALVADSKERYSFVDPETLLQDFWNDVEAWRR